MEGEKTILLLLSQTLMFFSFLSPSSGTRPGILPTLPAGWEQRELPLRSPLSGSLWHQQP